MNVRRALLALAMSAICTAAAAAPQNLVKNASFEDGTTDWSVHSFRSASDGIGITRMLTYCIGAGCADTPGSGAFLGQQMTTTPGGLYDLSFWTGTGWGPGEFSVYWNGLLIDDQPLEASTVLQHSYTSLLATSDTAYLEIHGRSDPAYVWVDDVSVVTHVVNAVPEPQTYAMLLSGLLFAGLAIRRGP
jgi:hypothetical protein